MIIPCSNFTYVGHSGDGIAKTKLGNGTCTCYFIKEKCQEHLIYTFIALF